MKSILELISSEQIGKDINGNNVYIGSYVDFADRQGRELYGTYQIRYLEGKRVYAWNFKYNQIRNMTHLGDFSGKIILTKAPQ